MHRQKLSTWRAALGVGVACAVCGGASTGCYQKVTRAEGFGASRISTEEPDRQPGAIDKLIFGQDKPSKKTVK